MKAERNITLRQGLEQFHKKNEEYLSHNKNGISSEAKTFFQSHDIAHVLFGCDITSWRRLGKNMDDLRHHFGILESYQKLPRSECF